MGKLDNTHHTYRGQLVRFAAWCDKSWLDVTPSDIGKYHRELKKGLKATSINHALNTLRFVSRGDQRSNQGLLTEMAAIRLDWATQQVLHKFYIVFCQQRFSEAAQTEESVQARRWPQSRRRCSSAPRSGLRSGGLLGWAEFS